jgi:ABC-2 type transport system permease protein
MNHELILLLKQRSILLLLFISLVLTSLSLLNGWQNISHIREQINHAQQEDSLQKKHLLAEYAIHDKIDAGEVGYYVFHYVYQHPSEWSFIALGNRLVTPYVQRIRLLGLQGQLYDGESHHPEYVMLGAFDFTFWLVFFSPLLCIALMHDLKASEFQAQRLQFLTSLCSSPIRFWTKRIMLRWMLVLMTLIIPIVVLALIKSLPLLTLILIVTITSLYTLLWTGLCAMVSLRTNALNASFNAMVLASIWLLLCVILPNLSQLWLHQRYTVQEGSQIALQHRQLVHNAWDLPKTDTLTPFYTLYPEWQHTPPVTGRFHWKWYYAFQHMADVNLAAQVEQRENSLRMRDHATAKLGYLMPSVWVQRQLEEVGQSNVTHLLAHRQKISNFHTQLRHTLYPYLFEDKAMTSESFIHLPKFSNK